MGGRVMPRAKQVHCHRARQFVMMAVRNACATAEIHGQGSEFQFWCAIEDLIECRYSNLGIDGDWRSFERYLFKSVSNG